MEELQCPEARLAPPEVVLATESPPPSLVDRYFTRWYKAGKCGMVVSSALLCGVDAAGTSATLCKPPVLFLELSSPRNTGLHWWRTKIGASRRGKRATFGMFAGKDVN